MKKIVLLLSCIALFAFNYREISSIHEFSIKSIEGKTINFKDYKGKKILVVNTASACGYTPQYEGLQKLYTDYKDKLMVVGFPCNQFGGQESGSEEEIKQFCKARFGVTFPLTTKVDVKGDNANLIYKWLCSKEQNSVLDAEIKWNFNKFLLDENGALLAYFPSKVSPNSEEILKYLK